MSRVFRLLTPLLTALVLVTGTLHMAYASGQAQAVDEMVICTGHGAITIGIDADGNPTGEVFYCPDCAATALDAVTISAAYLPADCSAIGQAFFAQHIAPDARAAWLELHARGPPASV